MYKMIKRAKNLVTNNRVGYLLVEILIVMSNKMCCKYINVEMHQVK